MNTGNNRMSINFDAALSNGLSLCDEETWLVQPPEEPNSSHSSGHVIEWLQEAALNVEYETRSALARKLAKQAAKKKKKAEKLSEQSDFVDKGSPHLSEIKEGAREEEEENLRGENDLSVEIARAGSSSCGCKRSNPAFLHERNVEELMMACNITSETSSDDEFYDVPEYPLFQDTSSQQPLEQRAIEKVRPLSHDLAAVKECAEDSRTSDRQDNYDEDFMMISPRLSETSDMVDTTPVRQTNTARVPPTVVVDKGYRRSSPSGYSRNSPPVVKSHSVASADLLDIQRKARQQELALREECNLWKPSSQYDCSTPAVRFRTNSSTHPDIMKGSLSMSSSHSADFLDTSLHAPSMTSTPVPPGRISRLPTPVRRTGLNVRPGGMVGGGSRIVNTSFRTKETQTEQCDPTPETHQQRFQDVAPRIRSQSVDALALKESPGSTDPFDQKFPSSTCSQYLAKSRKCWEDEEIF